MKIDESDWSRIVVYNWNPHSRKGGGWYAIRNLRQPDGSWRGTTSVHRDLLDAPKGAHIDHIDGDGLNNCRSNLRLATAAGNAQNRRPLVGASSPYKGVRLRKGIVARPWQAVIWRDGKQRSLGHYATEIEAAVAYDVAAVETFGEFAWLNFPERTTSA